MGSNGDFYDVANELLIMENRRKLKVFQEFYASYPSAVEYSMLSEVFNGLNFSPCYNIRYKILSDMFRRRLTEIQKLLKEDIA